MIPYIRGISEGMEAFGSGLSHEDSVPQFRVGVLGIRTWVRGVSQFHVGNFAGWMVGVIYEREETGLRRSNSPHFKTFLYYCQSSCYSIWA